MELFDVMLAKRLRIFLKSQNFEIGLIDCYKSVVNVLRASFKNLPRKTITYRAQKHFNQDYFCRDLDGKELQVELHRNCDKSYKKLSENFYDILNHHTPLKQVKGNYAPFMTKDVSKAIMNK